MCVVAMLLGSKVVVVVGGGRRGDSEMEMLGKLGNVLIMGGGNNSCKVVTKGKGIVTIGVMGREQRGPGKVKEAGMRM